MQQFEIKRKFFDVIEQLGDRSYKVQRKNDIYFLKDFGDDKKGFEDFIERTNKFKVCGVKSPKIFYYDKNSRLVVMEFIDGSFMSEILSVSDLDETIYQKLFETFWFGKIDKMYLDFKPGNFKLFNNKLYYLPFTYTKFENNDVFLQRDIKYWFATEELEKYLGFAGFSFDHSRIKNEYETNKTIALMSIKYYK